MTVVTKKSDSIVEFAGFEDGARFDTEIYNVHLNQNVSFPEIALDEFINSYTYTPGGGFVHV